MASNAFISISRVIISGSIISKKFRIFFIKLDCFAADARSNNGSGRQVQESKAFTLCIETGAYRPKIQWRKRLKG
jgi:hypothetical protein